MVPLRAAAAAAEAAAHRAAAEAEALAAAQRSATDAAAAVEAELATARAAVTAAEAAEREAATRAAAIAADATTLPQMLARVEATSRAAALRETADRRAGQGGPGAPALPVAGRIIRAFGTPEPGGPARGVTFAAPPGAQVVSPCAGRAAFAAPFRSYGRLLIVDCGGGYHVVLAGMADLAVPAGQRLLPGDPVGRLGAPEGGGGGRANLYVEVRRDGRPVDPRPFLAASG
jgi:septal ring factor EnvC (AmiA/AmiB activator)